jgi:membrane protein DedA with SNARE-associated domain
MQEILQNLIHHGYALLFLWLFLERLGIPIPAAIPLVSAGLLAEMKYMRFAYAMGLAFAAVMLGDIAWFFISRIRGVRVLSLLCRITLEPDTCVRKTQNLFTKHGPVSLVFAKFIPGLSNLTVALAGIVRLPLRTFLLFDSIGSLLWVGFFMGVGYIFSREIQPENIVLPDWGQGRVVIAILLLLSLYIVWKYLRKQYLLRKLFSNRITPDELKGKLDAGDEIAILDVRHLLEFEADPYVIPGALHFPLENLKRFSAVTVEREIVTYCA